MTKKPIEPLSKGEVDAIVSRVSLDPYYYTLFLLAKTTGRRIGELYGLQMKDLDFERGVMVTQVLKRRRRVDKEAVLTPEMVKQLKKYCNANRFKLDDYLFQQKTVRAVQKKIKSVAKRCGIKKNVVFHNFRHYFITELVKQGWSWEKIAKLTGHSNPATLVNYDHAVSNDIKEDALKALENI